MSNPAKLIELSNLRPGDVLLCPGDGRAAEKIAAKTDSPYTHAAICINELEAAEVGRRVQKINIKELLPEYPYIVAFRHPDAWGNEDVRALNAFVDQLIQANVRYNMNGIKDFFEREEEHNLSIHENLTKYFEGNLTPDSYIKERYFCSEFVSDCFIATGFISPSAAIYYKSDVTRVASLGHDPTYGFLLGYLSKDNNAEIPMDDEFIDRDRYDIFEGTEPRL